MGHHDHGHASLGEVNHDIALFVQILGFTVGPRKGFVNSISERK
jgi:hypothetical protein